MHTPNAPWIFVLGAPRSGTSLLRRLLSSHPRLFISPEVRILDLIYLTAVLSEHNGASPEEASVSPRALELGRSYAQILAQHQLSTLGKVRYGDKYPPYCLHLDALNALFPDAVFLHILRDGRDVVASSAQTRTANRGWRRSAAIPPTEQLVRDWMGFVQRARAAGTPLGASRYHEIRYEHLLSDPVSVLRDTCAFLGESFVPALLAGTAEIHAGQSWRETLSPAELATFHAVPGAEALLQRLGYPPTPHPSDQAVARAAGLTGPLTSSLAARQEGGEDTPALWAAVAEEAPPGSRARIAALVRALRGKTPDRGAILRLLACSEAPESVFAALHALPQDTPPARQALARWSQARGLDEAASNALFPNPEAAV